MKRKKKLTSEIGVVCGLGLMIESIIELSFQECCCGTPKFSYTTFSSTTDNNITLDAVADNICVRTKIIIGNPSSWDRTFQVKDYLSSWINVQSINLIDAIQQIKDEYAP